MKDTTDIFNNEYGITIMPDIFYCDDEGKVLYYSNCLKECTFEIASLEKKMWKLTVIETIGNIETWFKIQRDIMHGYIKEIYLRSTQRNHSNGQDEPLCLLIIPKAIGEIKQGFDSFNEFFSFPISFYFSTLPKIIPDHACPNYGKDENGEYVIDACHGTIKMDEFRKRREQVLLSKVNQPEKRRYF